VVNDTISDMLTRVRNANLARHKIVQIPSTKMTRSISSVLLEEGFIELEEIGDGINRQILLLLKYKGRKENQSLLLQKESVDLDYVYTQTEKNYRES